ncbi:MAG: hypothetical protein LDL38_04465 [Flavobacterium piscis]|nr:hypothetical protein [Flavobacterium piscis]
MESNKYIPATLVGNKSNRHRMAEGTRKPKSFIDGKKNKNFVNNYNQNGNKPDEILSPDRNAFWKIEPAKQRVQQSEQPDGYYVVNKREKPAGIKLTSSRIFLTALAILEKYNPSIIELSSD